MGMINFFRSHESLTAFCIFAVLTLMLTYPVVSEMGAAIPGDGGDAAIFVWDLWWMKHSILELHQNPFQTGYIFNPIDISLVFHAFIPLYGLIMLPIQTIFSPFVCYSIIFLLTFMCTGWATYRLARILGIGFVAALVAGFALTFCPVRLVRGLGHLSLLSTQWIPLFYVFMLLSFQSARKRDSAIAGMILAASFYTDYQLTVLLLISILLMFCYQVGMIWLGRGHFPTETDKPGGRLSSVMYMYVIMGLVFLVATGPVLYLAGQEVHWEGYYIAESSVVESFKTDLLYYLNPFHASWLFRVSGFVRDPDFWGTEKVLSPGFVAFFLAGIGLFFMGGLGKKRTWFYFWIILIIISFILSLGSHLIVAGEDTGLVLPYTWFRQVPVLGGVRVPGKFAQLVAFGLSLLAGLGYQGLSSGRSHLKRILGPLGIMLLMIELAPVPFPMQVIDPQNLNTGPVDCSIERQNRQFRDGPESPPKRIMQLPFGVDTGFRLIGEDIARQHILAQVFHQDVIMSGHVSRCPDDVLEFFNANPFLTRIQELQSSSQTRAMLVPTARMQAIAREWLYLTQTDRIVIDRFAGGMELLSGIEYQRLINFIQKHCLATDRQDHGPKTFFSFEPKVERNRSFDFVHHPENDVYIYNRFLVDQPDKFCDRDFIKTWYYFRMLFPGDPSMTRYITLDYRGYPEIPGVEGHIDVFLNREQIGELPYSEYWRQTRLEVPSSAVRRGVNALQLTYSLSSVPAAEHTSTVPFSIGLVSAGMNYGGCGVSRINVPLRDYSHHTRGFNVAYIDGSKGTVLRHEVYDTCEFEAESERFARDLDELEQGTIVAAVVHDDGSNKYNDHLERSLASIGGQYSLRRKFRYAYAIIGRKGWAPGTALEKMDELLVSLTNGNGVIGIRSVCVHQSPDYQPSPRSVRSAGLDQMKSQKSISRSDTNRDRSLGTTR
ncbi:hypothetical protein JXQ70_05860 [bacterium]|nr:hypothetical protein [bacterium]